MICKCPKCDGALEYNPAYDKMECPYCGSTFTTHEAMAHQRLQDNTVKMTAPSANNNAPAGGWETNPYAQQTEPEQAAKQATDTNGQITMECNIYT